MPQTVSMFVYNDFTHDTRVLKEAISLTANGYVVTIVAVLSSDTKTYEERHGIKIIRVVNDPMHYRILCQTRPVLDRVRARSTKLMHSREERQRHGAWKILWLAGVPYQVLKKTLLLFYVSLSLWGYYHRGFRVVAQEPADIYHAHDLNTLPLACWAAKRHSAKLVYDSHELYVERNTLKQSNRMGKFVLRGIEAFLIRRTDAVITVNESIANELAHRYGIPAPNVVMNTPFRTSGFPNVKRNSLRAVLGVDANNHILLYSGKITFNRGLEKVIESLEYLSDCHLVLMGYGSEEYKERLRTLAWKLGVGSRLSFFGPVAPEAVTIYASDADLGIAPIENVCLSYYYCSPNKMFEYISARLPVIASDFPELRKVIEKYDIGCTFDPSDSRDIARATRYVLEDRERRRRMEQNTTLASQAYNWENESKKLLELYSVLG